MPRGHIIPNDRKKNNAVDIHLLREKVPVPDEFNFMWTMGWTALLDSDLKQTDWKVFGALMEALRWEAEVYAETTKLSKRLGMTGPMVSTSITRLIQKKIFVDTGEKIGKTRKLKLASRVGYKGDLKSLYLKRIK